MLRAPKERYPQKPAELDFFRSCFCLIFLWTNKLIQFIVFQQYLEILKHFSRYMVEYD